MNDLPVWQLPPPSEARKNADAYIPKTVKYHCFIENVSLCKRYAQDTDYYETGIESGEILRRPEIACKKCRKMWLRRYVPEEVDAR